MENWKKRLERFHNGIIKSGECRAEQEGFLCCLEDEGVIDFISQELDRAREEGRREVYEAIVFDKNIPHDVTTFVAANLWKNMRDKAKEELSKLTTK